MQICRSYFAPQGEISTYKGMESVICVRPKKQSFEEMLWILRNTGASAQRAIG